MKLSRLLRSFRRNLARGLGIGAVVGLLTMLGSLFTTTPTYTATNLVLFQVAGLDQVQDPSTATTYATTLASSYTAMVNQPVVTEPLAKELDVDQAELAASLMVQPPRSNLVSTISTVGVDEQQAERTVTAAGRLLAQRVDATTDKVKGQPRIRVASQEVNVLQTPGTGRSLVGSLVKGAVAGLAALMAWLLAKALADARLRTAQDVAEVTDTSVLAHLHSPSDAPVLARASRYLPQERPDQVAYTSATGGEQIAPAVAGAAASLAEQAPGRVLLVDCDLRRGELSKHLGVQGPGLAQYLSHQAGMEQVVHELGALRVLPSGSLPPNPAELLASPELGRLLARLQQDGATVLLHAPGLLEHSDSALVASACPTTVVMVESGWLQDAQLREALDVLDGVGARLGGLVLVDGDGSGRRRRTASRRSEA